MIIWKYGKRNQLLLYILACISGSIANVGLAWTVTRFMAAATHRSLSQFTHSAIIGLGIFILLGVFSWLISILKAAITESTNVAIKSVMIKYMVDKQPLTRDSGQQISFMTNDLKMLETNGVTSELTIIEQGVTFLGAIVGSLYFDWVLTLAFLVGNMMPVLATTVMQKRVKGASKQWSKINASWTGQLKDFLSGLDTARAYQANDAVKQRTNSLAQSLEKSLFHLNFTIGTSQSLALLVALIFAMLLPFGIGVYRIILGWSSIAKFMGVMQLSNDISNPLLRSVNAYTQWGAAKPILAKITHAQQVDQQPASTGLPAPQDAPLTVHDAGVAFDHKLVFNHLNVTIQPGEKVLIMAPSGYGKSTFLRVLEGEIPLVHGSYQLGQTAATKIDKTALRKQFSLVKQDPFLFNDTLKYNITLGHHFALNQIQSAVKKAGLTDLVEDKGLDYQIVENGKNLSGGQIQRIEIARALLYNRPFLLADEATSALDDKLAAQVHQEFLHSSNTLIEVAHQVPEQLQRQYDRVVHLDQLSQA